MESYVDALLQHIARATPALRALDENTSARRPAPDKWSPREIIGHLIDSASNNHQRFVRGQLTEELVFPGYKQNGWVLVQHYQEAPWSELVDLWLAYNRHLARVMAAAPSEVRLRPRATHNLHELGIPGQSADRPGTLDALMSDYVSHLAHHLRQIPTVSTAIA
jgi:hypothetical protein